MTESLARSNAFQDGPRVRGVLLPGVHNLDAPLVDQYGVVQWLAVARRLSDDARVVYAVEVTHNGSLGADATTLYPSIARRFGADLDAVVSFAVALTGTGISQAILLTVTITGVACEVSFTRAPLIGTGE